MLIDSAIGASVAANILTPFYGGNLLTVSEPAPPQQTVAGQITTTRGTAPLLSTSDRFNGFPGVPVIAIVDRTNASDPDVALVFELPLAAPNAWHFASSLKGLPGALITANDQADGETDLNILDHLTGRGSAITAARIVLKSSDSGLGMPSDITGRKGLNFFATWTPAEFAGALKPLLPQPQIRLFGNLVLPGGALPDLENKLPWEESNVPGISLTAVLGTVAVGGLQLQLQFRCYSPMAGVPGAPGYEPALGFTGILGEQGISVADSLTVSARKFPGADPVLITLRPPAAGAGLDKQSDRLSRLLGVTLPQEITGALPQSVSLQSIAISIGTGGSVEQLAARFGAITTFTPQSATNWPFPAGINLQSASIAVLNHFDSTASVSAELAGDLSVTLGSTQFKLNVAARFSAAAGEDPSVEIYGEQDGDTQVLLPDLFSFKSLGTPPFNFPSGANAVKFEKFRFAYSSGAKTHSLSFTAATPWTIAGKNLADVRVSFDEKGWELGVGDEDSAIPIVDFFLALTTPPIDAPESLHDAALKSFTIKSGSGNGGIKVECTSTLPVGLEEPLEITLSLERTVVANTVTNAFKGTAAVAGLELDLILGKKTSTGERGEGSQAGTSETDSQSEDKPAFELKDVLSSLVPAEDAANLPDVSIALQDLLLFRRKETDGGTHSLIVADIGTSLDLSRQLERFGFHVGANASLKLRLLAASGSTTPESIQGFTPEQVEDMNDLLDDGIAKLPAEKRYKDKFAIRKGLDAILQLGSFNFGADASDTDAAGAPATASGAQPAAGTTSAISPLHWFSVQRSFGPVHISRVGAGFVKDEAAEPRVKFGLDASVGAAGLTLGLIGLSITSPPLKKPASVEVLKNVRFGLDGISLSYSQGDAIEISGAFLKDPVQDQFLGGATLRTAKLSLTAVGAYKFDPTSLFVFAVLDYPLGGPTFFFITGLAAGFGYNRDIKLPSIQGVKDFPLVAIASGSERPGFDKVLTDLGALVPPLPGAYWVAAGIHFTSFQLVESFALLVVKFGVDLEFLLLGTSNFSLPKNKPENPYLRVELAFRVSVKPNAGEFAAEALLTGNSFVIHPSCRLTGGFAFYAWFGNNPHAGDFVLTLGGYHPRFVAPAHYPQVPRLAINWPVSPEISIKGEAYFALTPSCVMAGGGLEATYQDGSVFASFSARADFLISWEPFFYDIEVSISLTIAVNWHTFLGTLHLGTHLSADLHIWGPEFAGTAHIEWSVISFDVAFGAKQTTPQKREALSWQQFSTAFLPPAAAANQGWTATGGDPLKIPQVNIERGLLREVEVQVGSRTEKQWVVLPDALILSTQTAFPSTQIDLVSSAVATTTLVKDAKALFSVAPMLTSAVSTHTVSITGPNGILNLGNGTDWIAEERRDRMPKALWGIEPFAENRPNADLVPDPLLTGLAGLHPGEARLTPTMDRVNFIPLSTFAFTELNPGVLSLTLDAIKSPARDIGVSLTPPFPGDSDVAAAISHIAEVSMKNRRTQLIGAAQASAFGSLRDGNLSDLGSSFASLAGGDGASARALFQSLPLFGVLGSGGVAPRGVKRPPPLPVPDIGADTIQTIITFLLSILHLPSAAQAASNTQVLDAKAVLVPRDPAADAPANDAAVPAKVIQEAPPQEIVTDQSLVLNVEHKRPSRTRRSSNANARAGAALMLSGEAGFRFRVATFDGFSQPSQDITLTVPPGATAIRHELTSGVGRVIVTALPISPAPAEQPHQPSTTFGWIASTPLAQVQRQVFVFEGGSVRTEALIDSPNAATGVGAALGDDIIAGNLLASPSGGPAFSGAFTTLLPADVKTLAMIVRRSGIAAKPGLGTRVTVTRLDGTVLHLEPLHIIPDTTGQVALLCRVPDGLQTDSGKIAIETQALGTGSGAGNWEIRGVMGMTQKVNQVRLNWESLRLKAPASQPAAAGRIARGQITIVAGALEGANV